MTRMLLILVCFNCQLLAILSHAHPGRRFEVQVIDDQLVAQGVITDGMDNGAGLIALIVIRVVANGRSR